MYGWVHDWRDGKGDIGTRASATAGDARPRPVSERSAFHAWVSDLSVADDREGGLRPDRTCDIAELG